MTDLFIPHFECYDPSCFDEGECRRDCTRKNDPWFSITEKSPPDGVVLEAVEDAGTFLCAYLGGECVILKVAGYAFPSHWRLTERSKENGNG